MSINAGMDLIGPFRGGATVGKPGRGMWGELPDLSRRFWIGGNVFSAEGKLVANVSRIIGSDEAASVFPKFSDMCKDVQAKLGFTGFVANSS